ncbi:MAG TPA: hypothetical protein PKD85_04815 [Saprospiraceae bacterium]|nr:hypothetical protein [Saprospiraceae bacterium]
MKFLNTILTIIYGLIAVYSIYNAIMHFFVYFANLRLGYTESLRLPLIYLFLAILFSSVTYIGYRIWTDLSANFLMKLLYYLPLSAIGLYVLWVILLIISSGGRWN